MVWEPLPDEQGGRVSVIGSVDELLARASSRTEVRPGDGKGGARYERVLVDGEPFFVKRLSPASDWIMRVTGDHVHRPYLVWRAGIMARSPGCIDHTVVAMQVSGTGDDAVLTMVMRDVGALPGPRGRHRRAGQPASRASSSTWPISAARSGAGTTSIGLTTMEQRLRFFAPDNIAARARWPPMCPRRSPPPTRAGAPCPAGRRVLSGLARLVHDRPEARHRAAGRDAAHVPARRLEDGQPRHPPRRAHHPARLGLPRLRPGLLGPVLVPGPQPGPAARAKEAAIGRFRAALEARGIATGSWWDAQLDLCLIGIMATFGWEKALGDDAELPWWERAVAEAAARQGIPVRRDSRVRADHYAGAGRRWALGATLVYGPIAAELVAMSPHPLAGRTVLDAGAGTGAASSALAARRARPVAMDLSFDMLAWNAARQAAVRCRRHPRAAASPPAGSTTPSPRSC